MIVTVLRKFWLPLAVLVVVLLITAAFFAGRYTVYQSYPELANREQAQVLLDEVAALIKLPENEVPQMVIIDNADEVRTQPFLAGAENGDVLIVYSVAQMALLYRPSEKVLVAVGPVTNTDVPEVTAPSEPIPDSIEDETATSTDS